MSSDTVQMIIFVVAGILTLGLMVFAYQRIKVIQKENKAVYERERLDREAKEQTPAGLPQQSTTATAAPPISIAPVKTPVTLDEALSATRLSFWGRIRSAVTGRVDADHREEIEEVLYTSDLGPKTVELLMQSMQEKVGRFQLDDLSRIKDALKSEMLTILETPRSANLDFEFTPAQELKVWLIVGVNGAGKTTTIGKLAHRLAEQGHRVLVAAGDTFRAAAGAQLKAWSERAQVEIFHPEGVLNPSAVAFDACKKAVSGGFTALIVDTAGRLHTQKNLMEELIKMKRVVDKAIPGAPHETLLVLDANAGQNALVQAREFHQALNLTGIILTKMDGSAKGGVALGVSHELGLPVKMIGIGEKMEDLRPFAPKEFVDAILRE